MPGTEIAPAPGHARRQLAEGLHALRLDLTVASSAPKQSRRVSRYARNATPVHRAASVGIPDLAHDDEAHEVSLLRARGWPVSLTERDAVQREWSTAGTNALPLPRRSLVARDEIELPDAYISAPATRGSVQRRGLVPSERNAMLEGS